VLELGCLIYTGYNTQDSSRQAGTSGGMGRYCRFPQFCPGASDVDSQIARRVGGAMVKSSRGLYGKY